MTPSQIPLVDLHANRLLDAVGTYLDLRDGFFRDIVEGGNSVLRVIHYRDLDAEANEPGAIRGAQHEDIPTDGRGPEMTAGDFLRQRLLAARR